MIKMENKEKIFSIERLAGLFGLAGLVLLLIILGVVGKTFWQQEDFFLNPAEEVIPVKKEAKESAKKVKIIFGGDLMFDRHIRLWAEEKGYDFIFSDLRELFFDYDLVVANLEGPITDNPSISQGTAPGTPQNFIFTFDPQVAVLLANHNIGVVCLGNNHILNFGQEGLESTRRYLSDKGVAFFGFAQDGQDQTLIKEINGLTLGFVNYNQFLEGGLAAAQKDVSSLVGRVDWLILYSHWGNEYQLRAGAEIEELAREFIDQGVDFIVGSHPHVVQQKEIYRGKTIYYSLGNFVFDQYFEPEVTRGLLVGIEINLEHQAVDIKEWPIIMLPGGATILDRGSN